MFSNNFNRNDIQQAMHFCLYIIYIYIAIIFVQICMIFFKLCVEFNVIQGHQVTYVFMGNGQGCFKLKINVIYLFEKVLSERTL